MGAIAAALIGAAATAGTAVYSSQQAKKQQDRQMEALNGANMGKTPEAALYEPVDFNEAQIDAILANTNALDSIRTLVNGANNFITNDALRRAEKLVPGYSASMRAMGVAANDLVNARLPSDVVAGLISDRSEAGNALGIPGVSEHVTLKDLGMNSLGAISQGNGLLGNMVSMAEAISPRSSYMMPQSMMVSPTDLIRLTMEQNALIQQSEQNRNNLKAGANPTDMARLGMEIGRGGGAGSEVNWAQVGGSMAQTLYQGYRDYRKDHPVTTTPAAGGTASGASTGAAGTTTTSGVKV